MIRKKLSKSTLLSILCFMVYACSYLGKYSYNSNINPIMEFFEISHAEAGLVATFFFFAYGFGQFFHGAMCKRYNAKYAISLALIGSAILNVILPSLNNFAFAKWIWGLNGICLGLLWPTITRFLLINTEPEKRQKTMYLMCMSTPAGILLAYSTSALMINHNIFKTSFYISSIVLPIMAVIWFIFSNKLKQDVVKIDQENNLKSKIVWDRKLVIYLGFFAFDLIVIQLIREGLTSWTPTILKETLQVSDSLSLLLTILLPMISLLGPILTSLLNKKIKKILPKIFLIDIVLIPLLFGVLFGIKKHSLIITLILFCIIYLMSTVSENTCSSNIPILLRDTVDYGFITGFLNGCAYVGSTISTYTLGLIADYFGWDYIFYFFILLIVIIFMLLVISRVSKNDYFDKTL